MINEERTTRIALYDYKFLKKNNKCLKCKKNPPVVLIGQYLLNKDTVDVAVYCKDCFREEIKEYTLEDTCIVCRDNLNCNMQRILFSKKEIRDFKTKYWGNNREN